MNYISHISWKRGNAAFNTKSFDRTHDIALGSGTQIQASSAPEYLGNAALANPEELFTASISSCFMLTFLYWAAMKNIVIDEYTAEVVGKLGKNSEGKMAMTEVTIKPKIKFGDNSNPDSATLNELYKKAHDNCFISSSVKTSVKIES
jgi:organic hydroperoxide reductase OsmC/OhrA